MDVIGTVAIAIQSLKSVELPLHGASAILQYALYMTTWVVRCRLPWTKNPSSGVRQDRVEPTNKTLTRIDSHLTVS